MEKFQKTLNVGLFLVLKTARESRGRKWPNGTLSAFRRFAG